MSKEKKAAPEAERETKAPDPAEDGAQDAQECVSEDGAAVQTEIDDLQKQLEAAKKQSDEYLNMAQRVQADFENFRRRNNAVRADAYEDGARAFIKTILPVMDNLERALAAESADAALHEGVSMVHRQLSEALEKRGVTVIDCAGEKFDPRLEDAVMQADASEGEPGTVCLVLQKGYQLGDVVLRHAMVKVVAEA
ncbi:MAG: nucleotide exchange factor GrpE [Clostridiales bacterium]|nr:nucleotide exchange factor GrpE [Eubacteriales bacterium]MCI5765963.1 nucleotide exchange factor GrpE [Clostridiales bacterium]MDD7122975.1 nucleotide exchange factor GrpE [Clostridiales bacterium]MDY5469821.1 nucleotide exchange factor GrpE [Eubacteriales bacterium]